MGRIPRVKIDRLGKIPEEAKENIVKGMKVGLITGVPMKYDQIRKHAGCSEASVRAYLIWLKKYGWAESIGKRGWIWIDDDGLGIDPKEIVGACSIVEYGFRF